VHNKVAPKLLARKVIDAACSIGDVTKDQALNLAELANDIGNKG
jgi:hypothetical protein